MTRATRTLVGTGRRRFLSALLALALPVVALLTPLHSRPVAAQEDPAPDAPVDLGVYVAPLRFEAAPGTTLSLDDGRPFTGIIETRLGPDGELILVNELPLDEYVDGIAEMPVSWPMEALKAQAVAARTYAWFELEQGRWRRFGYDICATTSCQVFHGAEVVQGPQGERWAEAVDATAGEVLVFDGAPILARYFSTSGGRTRDNEAVFPSEGARPYLKAVDDPDDAVSPLHRWQVTFTREQLDAILSRADQLSAAVPLAGFTSVRLPSGRDVVRATSQDGTQVEVSASSFRSFVSSIAPELYPDDFPSERPDGRRLPTTIPSSRFEVTFGEDEVVLDGRGWGHGVGMGQWGANGKAQRGLGYVDILAAYYNGLTPVATDRAPDRIRVGLERGLERVELRADGPFRVLAGDQVITERGLGGWAVEHRPDATLRLLAPTGFGAPLVVAPTQTSRPEPLAIEIIELTTVVNKASELALEVVDRSTDEVVLERSLGVVEAGRHDTVWSLDDGAGAPVAPGAYDARIVANDEEGTHAGEAVTVSVRAPEFPAEPGPTLLEMRTPSPPPSFPPVLLTLSAVLGALLGAGAAAAATRRR